MQELNPDTNAKSIDEGISRCSKWLLWLLPWCVIVPVMGIHNVPAAPYFPIGMFTFFLSPENGITLFMIGGMGIFPSLVGWMIYILLSARIALTSRRIPFFAFYSIFCILLILNVIGCKKIMEVAAGIQ